VIKEKNILSMKIIFFWKWKKEGISFILRMWQERRVANIAKHDSLISIEKGRIK